MPIYITEPTSVTVSVDSISARDRRQADVEFSIDSLGYLRTASSSFSVQLVWEIEENGGQQFYQNQLVGGWGWGDYDSDEIASFSRIFSCNETNDSDVSLVEVRVNNPVACIGYKNSEEISRSRRELTTFLDRKNFTYLDVALMHYSNVLKLRVLSATDEDTQKSVETEVEKEKRKQRAELTAFADKTSKELDKFGEATVKRDKNTAEYKAILSGLSTLTSSVKVLSKQIESLVKEIKALPLFIRKEIDASFDQFVFANIEAKVRSITFMFPNDDTDIKLSDPVVTTLLVKATELLEALYRLDEYGQACYPLSAATTLAAINCLDLIANYDPHFKSNLKGICDEGITRFSEMLDESKEGSFGFALKHAETKIKESEIGLEQLGLGPNKATEYFSGWQFNLFDIKEIPGLPFIKRYIFSYSWFTWSTSAVPLNSDWTWNGMKASKMLAQEPEIYITFGPFAEVPSHLLPTTLPVNFNLTVNALFPPVKTEGGIPALEGYQQQAQKFILDRVQATIGAEGVAPHVELLKTLIKQLQNKRNSIY